MRQDTGKVYLYQSTPSLLFLHRRNSHEAKYAHSRADFISKLEIALKECYEAEYWLEILYRVDALSPEQFKSLSAKCGTIRRKLIASITTAKGNK